MENITQAVNDELMQSLDYKLATSNKRLSWLLV